MKVGGIKEEGLVSSGISKKDLLPSCNYPKPNYTSRNNSMRQQMKAVRPPFIEGVYVRLHRIRIGLEAPHPQSPCRYLMYSWT